MLDFKPLKLFRLPSLAYEDVLRYLDTFEIISISLCSKKSRTFAARAKILCKNNVELSVLVGNISGIEILSGGKKIIEIVFSQIGLGEVFGATIYHERFESKIEPGKITLNFMRFDPQKILKVMVNHIRVLYNQPVKELRLENCIRHDPTVLFNFIDTPDRSIKRLSATDPALDLPWILEKVDRLEYLEVGNQNLQTLAGKTLQCEELKLSNCENLTLAHILTFKCSYLTIEFSQISSIDINLYIQAWIRGELPELKHATFVTGEMVSGDVFEGTQRVYIWWRQLKHNRTTLSRQLPILGGHDFRSDGGRVATFFYSNVTYGKEIIDFVVWDN